MLTWPADDSQKVSHHKWSAIIEGGHARAEIMVKLQLVSVYPDNCHNTPANVGSLQKNLLVHHFIP